MGFGYLQGKYWGNITKDEKYFCSKLFQHIVGSENQFVKWLNDEKKLELTFDEMVNEWEAGFSVYFYRDYYSTIKKVNIKNSGFSPQRSFDLCLFSDNRIIIIEAKINQIFQAWDLEKFLNDKISIPALLERDINVNVIGLAAAQVFKDLKETAAGKEIQAFDGFLTWEELFRHFGDKAFDNAEKIYGS